MVCAGVVLLALGGCSPHSFLTLDSPPTRYKQVVPGRVDSVAAMLETGLQQDGIRVLSKRLDGEVRLAGQAQSGKIFCLDLKREQIEGAEKTAVTVRWDREADEQLWRTVVEILAVADQDENSASRTP
jgi:hypothetical protein